MIKYAMMLVRSNLGWLAVSRKDDLTKMGVPGGKIDPGENALDAAVRETFEETGIVVAQAVLVHETDISNYYYATQWSGDICTQEIATVDWVSVTELTKPEAAFPAENTACFNSLFKIFPELLP